VEEKPPQQKPNGTATFELQQLGKTFWVLTGASRLSAERLRNTNRRMWRVHAAIANPLRGSFGCLGEKNGSVASITRSGAFIILKQVKVTPYELRL
jgi:hypothetical protein